MLKYFSNNKGIGLVEILISLAVVGTAMVIITSLTLSSLRLARKNEYQDVAIQSGVEALDFLKDPVEIKAVLQGNTTHLYDTTADSFYLDITATPPQITEVLTATPITTCTSNSQYKVQELDDEGFLVCRQILILSDNGSTQNFYVTVNVVWESIGGEFDSRTIDGYRYGTFDI